MRFENGSNRGSVVVLLIGAVLTLAGAQVCRAQAGGTPSSVFQQLFPKPTGENGYEELVQAAEFARDSVLLGKAEEPGATYRMMRDALADPAVVNALKLLRAGITKPVAATRQNMDENTLLPELPLLRGLGRLLKVEQYVLLAEGHNTAAIDSMRDALRLAQVIQSNYMMSGFIGISIDSIAAGSLASHIESFSIPDCDRLLRLLDAWLAQPSPMIRLLKGERDIDIALLRSKREDSAALRKLLDNLLISAQSPPSSSIAEIDHLNRLQNWVEKNPGGITAVVDQAAGMVDGLYQRTLAMLKEPTWTWKDPPPPDETSLAGQLASSIISGQAIGKFLDRYIADRARIQLLALHTAIRRFRWEKDRLPGSLQELNLGDRALDPFTGKPLLYMHTINTYELSSVGGLDRSNPDNPSTWARTPLTLLP